MKIPTPRRRRLAWVVLGVVAVLCLGIAIQLSTSLYTPWRPCIIARTGECGRVRHKRLHWLPGREAIVVRISREEYAAMVRNQR